MGDMNSSAMELKNKTIERSGSLHSSHLSFWKWWKTNKISYHWVMKVDRSALCCSTFFPQINCPFLLTNGAPSLPCHIPLNPMDNWQTASGRRQNVPISWYICMATSQRDLSAPKTWEIVHRGEEVKVHRLSTTPPWISAFIGMVLQVFGTSWWQSSNKSSPIFRTIYNLLHIFLSLAPASMEIVLSQNGGPGRWGEGHQIRQQL